MASSKQDIEVVVAIDFGTVSSGYAYANKSNPSEITVENRWDGFKGYKTPTIIKYDESYSSIISWGFSALPEKPKKKRNDNQSKPIELFKLFLFKEKSFLPDNLDYKRVISDYLRKLSEMIKGKVNSIWPSLNFYSQVLIVLTVPVEFDDDAIAIMRDCAFNANLIKERSSRYLLFITEPEAAAIHCLNSSEKNKLKPGDSFIVVDCGGGAVNLTSHNESKYLQDRIIKEFNKTVSDISVPLQPMIAAVKGGVQYGLRTDMRVHTVLKRTYGTDTIRRSLPGDPPSQILPNGYTIIFDPLVERGKPILVNEKVVREFKPHSMMQRIISFDLYVTKASNAKFCNDPGVSLLRPWEIELPENVNYEDVTILFTLTFGTVEILATAENQKTGEKYPVVRVEYD
ncbi:unnamed protein product [Rhizophagus irregularis]|uniref:Actin-like ATPase domain-containing protein n=1 Tax=Rhizophagus irregularis TaxID=588596 RepID=A0A915ZKR1_9GLOM|nr:unnamed protein product [Rhizophagus irregularis]